eukprot:CAMPEP_0171859674 /NCGR_PEP_ID=MMETSP0992-20121227/26031_1 /TAXON_ID=483369 /ORGANISM="non described non described, Strain CCMP2098" /LENGTH=158 /DNA_ID=CAMNT_0012481357 /DNA_START=125 /DNA_END=604 /DNA_ORIENTATION=-
MAVTEKRNGPTRGVFECKPPLDAPLKSRSEATRAPFAAVAAYGYYGCSSGYGGGVGGVSKLSQLDIWIHCPAASALRSATNATSAAEKCRMVVMARSMCSFASNSSVHKYLSMRFLRYCSLGSSGSISPDCDARFPAEFRVGTRSSPPPSVVLLFPAS